MTHPPEIIPTIGQSFLAKPHEEVHYNIPAISNTGIEVEECSDEYLALFDEIERQAQEQWRNDQHVSTSNIGSSSAVAQQGLHSKFELSQELIGNDVVAPIVRSSRLIAQEVIDRPSIRQKIIMCTLDNVTKKNDVQNIPRHNRKIVVELYENWLVF